MAQLLIVRAGVKSLNPNEPLSASYSKSIPMKQLFILCICSMALATSLLAQTPTAAPVTTSPTPTAASIATSTPTVAATALASGTASSSDLADRVHKKLQKKFRSHHGIIIDGGDENEDPDLRKVRDLVAIPIVAIVFLSIFGAPVLIVVTIGLFALIISRMRQRTIRMMVEKGQPVPAELLVPATRGARRSDVRRGVIWAMIGLGAMIFFGAVNNWEEGVWSLGLIPFLIGVGYLLVWKLEGKKDVPPPPPVP
jgi:hypothetical protein